MECLERRRSAHGSGALQHRVERTERALCVYFASDQSVLDAEDAVQFRTQMLRRDEEEESSDDDDGAGVGLELTAVRRVLLGISNAAYVRQLAVLLCQWHETGVNPIARALSEGFTDDEAGITEMETTPIEGVTADRSSRERVLRVSAQSVDTFLTAIAADDVPDDICVAEALTLVEHLGGARGLLTLLGFQQTVGSRTLGPLTHRQCVVAFSKPHTVGEKLTVGARALSKHCARSSSGWWGELKGNDVAKNARARGKLRELLAGATWKNVHSLPHAHATMELRNALGYGARWDAETQAFRGFLEPQMADGHALRWRH